MSQRNESVEFIRLNGQAVRASSWTPTNASGFRLVAVVRGVGEANSLAKLFEQSPLELELPGEELMNVTIAQVERREAGEPPVVISRFEVLFELAELTPQLREPLRRSIEERLASLEMETAALRSLVDALANRDQHLHPV